MQRTCAGQGMGGWEEWLCMREGSSSVPLHSSTVRTTSQSCFLGLWNAVECTELLLQKSLLLLLGYWEQGGKRAQPVVRDLQWIVPFFYTQVLIFLPAKQWLLSLTALELEYFSLMFCLSAERLS